MKIAGFILGLGLSIFINNIAYAGAWVPANPAPVSVVSAPVVEVPMIPSVTYSTYAKPLIIMYDWVPYTVNHLVVTEKQGLFCRHRTYHYEPRVEWIYQPVWKPATY